MAREDDVEVLVRRIFKDISSAFRRNPDIDEIGVIACPEARYNRSPVVAVGPKLGLESWCLKLLAPHLHSRLVQHRRGKIWLDPDALVELTHTLLLLNPDCTTAWNVRKELIQVGLLQPGKDLWLGRLALSRFPKSPDTWIHRRWLLQRLVAAKEIAEAPSGDFFEAFQTLLHGELVVCTAAADRYPSNYNAWSHRCWVIQHLAGCCPKVLQAELESTQAWVENHVSDHSGFHYRQFLLGALAADTVGMSQACVHMHPSTNIPAVEMCAGGSLAAQHIHNEFDLCTDLNLAYPGHESLWSHRRFLFHLWHKVAGAMSGEIYNGPLRSLSPLAVSLQTLETHDEGHERKRLKRCPSWQRHDLQAEQEFAAGFLAKSMNHVQSRFASTYLKWIDAVSGSWTPP
uniref:Protein prenyltransferase alpha subunit repeat containing 1 n=1 Tax=Eptatretus burgeri TaxID=7764 RepID=A0A8C4NG05_EPTBU